MLIPKCHLTWLSTLLYLLLMDPALKEWGLKFGFCCQGNRLFKEGKYELAKAKYEKVCALFLCYKDLYMKVGALY